MQEMMTKVFSSDELSVSVRILTDQNGEPWFVAADVAAVLEYGEASAMTRHLDDDERGLSDWQTLGGRQELITINESGLYSAILRSSKPKAKLFKKWVTAEVLPSIRKHGGYVLGQEQDDPEIIMAKALQVAQSVIERKTLELQQAKAVIAIQAPKAEFADRVAGADKGTLIGNFAKTVGLGPKQIFVVLRELRILMSGGNRHNLPFQEYLDRGYFSVIEKPYEVHGETRLGFQPMITGKGQQWLTKRLIDSGHLKGMAA